MNSRFNNWPLPDAIQVWACTPEAWQSQPPLDNTLLWLLADILALEGTEDLDVASSNGASQAATADDEEMESAAGVTLDQIAQVTKNYKDTKRTPSMADGSTTVGTGTTGGTGTTTGTASTCPTGATDLM